MTARKLKLKLSKRPTPNSDPGVSAYSSDFDEFFTGGFDTFPQRVKDAILSRDPLIRPRRIASILGALTRFVPVCPEWVDPYSSDLLNEYLFDGQIHSINDERTLRALSKFPRDTTGTFIRDMISVFLHGQGVIVCENLVVSNSDTEYFHLWHKGPRRPGNKYFDSRHDTWTDIFFDRSLYWELRPNTSKIE